MTKVDCFDGANARQGGGGDGSGGASHEEDDLVVVAPVVDGRMKNMGA